MSSPYSKFKRAPSSTQRLIHDFFEKNAVDDPCRASVKKQLLKPVPPVVSSIQAPEHRICEEAGVQAMLV